MNFLITGNYADLGGGIYCWDSNSNLMNIALSVNFAVENGGGIYCQGSSVNITNTTITFNNAAMGNYGGLDSGDDCNIHFINSIVWNNTPEEVDPPAFFNYSDIRNGWPGEGNIDDDPLFAGTGEHPYSLLEGSPCIDTGNPDTLGLNLPPWDIIGNERIWDGDGDGTAIIDMGAYEFDAPPYNDVNDNIIVQTPGVHLYQNYPNPFNPTTTINFSVTQTSSFVTLEIYNIKGQLAKTLVKEIKPAGEHSIIWDGRDFNGNKVGSGIYFYRLRAGDFQKVRKMIFIK
ncbi:MAG: T9SS type A sorting domain-containing protein [Candidatus Cloacimonetes bacterium]|nr:T9SS type A sorting domain-containing protein [Candidatus Cloacimonadota bacterium]